MNCIAAFDIGMALSLRTFPHESKPGVVSPECQRVIAYVQAHGCVPHDAHLNKKNALHRLYLAGYLSPCEESLSGYRPSLMLKNMIAYADRLWAEENESQAAA